MVTATNGSTLSFQPLVLVEQKVKVSLPSASNSLLTDCTARGPRPRDIKAHISIQAAPQRLGLRALPCLPRRCLLGNGARCPYGAHPHHHQSYPKPCVETAMKATEPPCTRLPFLADQGFSLDGQRVIWRGERPTARYSDGRSLVTYFHRLDSGTVRSSLVTNFQSRAIWAHPSLLGQQLKTFHQLIQS